MASRRRVWECVGMCGDWATSISQHLRDTSRPPQRNITTEECASRAAHESHKKQSQKFRVLRVVWWRRTVLKYNIQYNISVHKATSARAWEFARGAAASLPAFNVAQNEAGEACGFDCSAGAFPRRFPAALQNTVARSPPSSPRVWLGSIFLISIRFQSFALLQPITHETPIRSDYTQARTFSRKSRWIASRHKATCTHAVRWFVAVCVHTALRVGPGDQHIHCMQRVREITWGETW